jgi:hypothetical protein
VRADRLMAIASALVGGLALAVSTYNVWLQRKQIRAQVWPRLTWSNQNVEGFSFNLDNAGVGPADVRAMQVRVDDKPVSSWGEALALLVGKDVPHQNTWVNGTVLAVGAMVHPMAVQDPEAAGLVEAQARRIHVRLCYCSTLDECWLLEDYKRPAEVDSCPTFERPFEQ